MIYLSHLIHVCWDFSCRRFQKLIIWHLPFFRMFGVGYVYGRDDDRRFGFFCRSALEFLLQSGSSPVSIIHNSSGYIVLTVTVFTIWLCCWTFFTIWCTYSSLFKNFLEHAVRAKRKQERNYDNWQEIYPLYSCRTLISQPFNTCCDKKIKLIILFSISLF